MADDHLADKPETRKQVRRRASRAAGPVGEGTVATVTAVVDSAPTATTVRPVGSVGPPPRRRPNRARVAAVAGGVAVVLIAVLSTAVLVLAGQQRDADALASREQRFVDTATQTVVNMFTYTPDTVDDSVNLFVDGISGPLRDMMSQNNNVENLKSLFRDTNATSEAVVSGAALEEVDPDTDNGSVLVAVRVTVTDIDGVNKPSQAYRMRVIVHEDDNGRMTGYDLKYPDGGN
ncbi:MAG: hypothetical protein K0R68_445 [Mycobacterium sp.]|jgi:Mce-associated membrane protein|nr:hypothetical protein [Mycobacterium sp.]